MSVPERYQKQIEGEEEFRKKYPEAYKPFEWADKYVAQYPHLFRGTHHVGIHEGWAQIFENLCEVLDDHISNLPEELASQIYIVQVKEKFGTLRVYCSHETPYMSGAITYAERLSGKVCEYCGAPGTARLNSWIKTMCNSCHERNERDKREIEEKK